MSTTLTNLIDSVNSRLSNFVQFASFQGWGDGSATTYKLNDAPIISGSESVTVDSSALSEDTSLPVTAAYYYLDDDTGWIVFGTAPTSKVKGTDAANITVTYRYRMWSDTQVTEAINAAVDFLFPNFYIVGFDDDTVTNGTAVDYPLPPETEKVMGVLHCSTNTSSSEWDKLDEWDVRRTNSYQVTAHTSDYAALATDTTLTLASGSGRYVTIGDVLKDAASNELVQVSSISTDTLTITRGYRSTTATTHASAATWTKWNDRYLHFASAPASGYLRLNVQKRSTGLTSASDTLEYTAQLPARAAEAIVLYSCWFLLSQRIPVRVRNDVVPRASGEWVITVEDMIDAASLFNTMFQMQLPHLRMRPVTGRWSL
jgi:type 1 fimbria pilin